MADKKISALTAKSPPVDADSIPIYDSVGVATKRITGTVLKAYLKTYFDSIYGTPIEEALGGSGTSRTVSQTPITGTLTVFDGSAKLTGGGVDYTLSAKALTFGEAPDSPRAIYRYA